MRQRNYHYPQSGTSRHARNRDNPASYPRRQQIRTEFSSDNTEKDAKKFNEIINQLAQLQPYVDDFQFRINEYKSYFQKIKNSQSLTDSFYILEDMLRENLFPNIFCLGQLIKQLSYDKKNYDFLKQIYDIIEKNNITNAVILNLSISKLGKHDDYYSYCKEKFDAAFNYGKIKKDAEGKDLVNDFTFNTMINIALLNKKIAHANHYCDQAIEKNLISVESSNAVIDALGKHNKYVVAKKKFDAAFNDGEIKKDAERKNLVNVITFTTMINIALLNEEFEDANHYCDQAIEKNLISVQSLNAVIDALGKHDQYELAQKKFNAAYNNGRIKEDARRKNLVDVITFTTMINIALFNKKIADANDYCDQAIKNNLISVASLNAVIDALGKHDQYELAQQKFDAAYNNGRIKEDAERKDLVNATTFATIIRGAHINGQSEDVDYYLKEFNQLRLFNKLPLKITKKTDYQIEVDLHYCTYNEAYAGLYNHIKNQSLTNQAREFSFTIIYGKGKHSKIREDGEDHDVKEATYDLMKNLEKEGYTVGLTEDPKKNGNTGEALCKITPLKVTQRKRFLPKQDEDESNQPPRKKLKLDPDVPQPPRKKPKLDELDVQSQVTAFKLVREERLSFFKTDARSRAQFIESSRTMLEIAQGNNETINQVLNPASSTNKAR